MTVAWARSVQCGNAKQLVQSEESYCDNRLIAWADGTVHLPYESNMLTSLLMEAYHREPPQRKREEATRAGRARARNSLRRYPYLSRLSRRR